MMNTTQTHCTYSHHRQPVVKDEEEMRQARAVRRRNIPAIDDIRKVSSLRENETENGNVNVIVMIIEA